MTLRFSFKSQGVIKAACTGAGFALGFGWIWFSGLQGFWLPRFLWGNFRDFGGTSVFIAILLAGYFSLWFLLRAKRKKDSNRKFAKELRKALYGSVNTAHGLGLFLLLIGFLVSSDNSHEWLSLIPPICSSLAMLSMGLFWFGAMLGLASLQILLAFCSASLTALLLNLICEFMPERFLPLILCLGMVIAWMLALYLERGKIRQYQSCLEQEKQAEKRPRGRPPKKAAEPDTDHESLAREVFWKNFVLFPILVFVMLSLGVSVIQEKDLWLADSFFVSSLEMALLFCGAVAGSLILFPVYGRNPEKPFLPVQKSLPVFLTILVIQSLVLLVTPPGISIATAFFEGLFCALVFYLLAGIPEDQIHEKAALVLGIILFLGNLAAGFGSLLVNFLPDTAESTWQILISPERIVGIPGLGVAGVLAFLLHRKKDVFVLSAPSGDASLFEELTTRERELADLVAANRTNREIGQKLNISEATVRFHLRNIYQKTGLSTREELCAWIQQMREACRSD